MHWKHWKISSFGLDSSEIFALWTLKQGEILSFGSDFTTGSNFHPLDSKAGEILQLIF